MPTCYLFTVLSSVSLSGWSRYDNHETRLWLQMAMQVVLLIFSGLLFAFSRTKQNEAIQILLSLAEVFVIIYQGIYLSLYCVTCPRWFRWPSLVVFILYCNTTLTLIVLLSTCDRYARTLEIMLLAFFFAGYLLIDVAYLLAFWLRVYSEGGEGERDIHIHILWNIGLYCIVWLGTLVSLICYWNDKTDFITALSIDNEVALVPIVWMLCLQYIALKKAWHRRPSSLGSSAGSDSAFNDSIRVR